MFRHLISRHALWLAVCLAACAAGPAVAQQVVLTVNGYPITSYDIEQRGKLIQLTTHKAPTRQEILDDLINDKLKLSIASRYKLDPDENEVNRSFNEMAHRMRMDGDQLVKVLAQQGVAAYTLKDRLRSDLVWQQIVRGKFASTFQETSQDAQRMLETRKDDAKDVVSYEYTLRPILFVVPRGSGDAVIEQRKRDAEALKARFESCDSGLAMARGMRDVAVRDPIRKNSADLAPALRDILDKTPLGHVTNPEVTNQGVEFFALCGKRALKDETTAKREVQNQLFSEKFQSTAAKFLKELRKSAIIEYKDGSDARAAGGNLR